MSRGTTPLERAAAVFLTRTMAGFVYLFEGLHAPFGVLPLVHIVLGALVLVGFRTRAALRCLGALIILTAVWYGVDGLRHPMGPTAMNIMVVNFYILPRAALVIITLWLPGEDDLISADAALDGRARRGLKVAA
jgi:hypothetical protein